MIIEVRAKNCYAFSEEIVFSLKADMRIKKFSANVYKENNFNVLKTVGIYGANNVGKTCIIKCIKNMKDILLNSGNNIQKNIFSGNLICNLGITFLYQGRKFDYSIKYDVHKEEYMYEEFIEIEKDIHGNEKKVVFLVRDYLKNKYFCSDSKLKDMLPMISRNNIIIYLLDTDQFEELKEMKEILTLFATKIDVIDMNKIPIKHTIDLMKKNNELQEKMVDFIKNADLNMENFIYSDINENNFEHYGKEDILDKDELVIRERVKDVIRLTSIYRGVAVPSMIFDSTGTKKIISMASYIIEAIEYGKILVIDELDSSIHFKLTRAIVAMFNNELNHNAQLIFTVHDINLMDCQKLLRKEQIWFLHKDLERIYLYSLADYTAEQGVRDNSDIIDKYRKGMLGAIPDPELINSLLSMKGNKKGELDE